MFSEFTYNRKCKIHDKLAQYNVSFTLHNFMWVTQNYDDDKCKLYDIVHHIFVCNVGNC